MAKASSEKNIARREIKNYDKYRERFKSPEEMAEAYAKALTYAIFTEHDYEWAFEETQKAKGYIMQAVKEATGKTFWDLEDYCLKNEVSSPIVYWFYQLCLLRSFWSLEDFIFYMEQDRMQGKRFYLPRMNPLHRVIEDIEDLFYRKIKFLGVSMPPRTGKSTLCLFALSWLAMKRPNSNSAMCGHSGILTNGFYDELINFFTEPEYRFSDIYGFWNPNKTLIQDKSAEFTTINLDAPDRLNTLTCRGIDGSWTGAINISYEGVLYVDDLVRDRQHALSHTRMEGTWNDYLNKVHDRLNPYCAKGGEDPREFLMSDELFPEPPELMVGTLWNIYDPLFRYEQKYGDNELYRFTKIPALNDEEKSNFEYVPTVYFLNQKEILSEADFAAKFQQRPFAREGILFKRNELNYFNGEIPHDEPRRIIAVLDPAVGGGDNLSMPLVWIGKKKKYVIDWIYNKGTKGVTIPKIIEKIKFYRVGELFYEQNGIGRVFEDPIRDGLKNAGFLGCRIKHFNAPERMKKEEAILNYSDAIKSELWFIDEMCTNTTYKRTEEYGNALWDTCTFSTMGKNKTDDGPDSLAQVMRVLEKDSNGSLDVILNPFR